MLAVEVRLAKHFYSQIQLAQKVWVHSTDDGILFEVCVQLPEGREYAPENIQIQPPEDYWVAEDPYIGEDNCLRFEVYFHSLSGVGGWELADGGGVLVE